MINWRFSTKMAVPLHTKISLISPSTSPATTDTTFPCREMSLKQPCGMVQRYAILYIHTTLLTKTTLMCLQFISSCELSLELSGISLGKCSKNGRDSQKMNLYKLPKFSLHATKLVEIHEGICKCAAIKASVRNTCSSGLRKRTITHTVNSQPDCLFHILSVKVVHRPRRA